MNRFFILSSALFLAHTSSALAVEIKSNALRETLSIMKRSGATESSCKRLEHDIKDIPVDNIDNDVNWHLAVCNNNMFKPGKAIKYLKKILVKSPDNQKAQLELATAYYLNRNFSHAKKIFIDLLKQGELSKIARKNVESLVKKIEKSKTYGGSVSIGYMTDDNVNSGTESSIVSIFNLPFTLSDSMAPLEDNARTYNASIYKTFFLNKNISTNVSYRYARLDYEKYASKNYDLSARTVAVSPSLTLGKFGSNLNLSSTKISLGHEKYSDVHKGSLKSYYRLSQYLVPEYTISHKKMDYKRSNTFMYEGKSNTHRVGLKFNIFNGKKLLAYVVPYFEREESDLKKKYTSNTQNKYGVQYVQTLPFKSVLSLNYYYGKSEYDGSDPLYIAKRDNESNVLNASISKALPKGFLVSLSYSYRDQESDITLFDYKKEQVSSNISYRF